MRDLGHGRVEHLGITDGKLRLAPGTKLLRLVRLDRIDRPPARRTDHRNHRPHAQHEKLLADCRLIGNGVIRRVEDADGLPVHWDSA